VGFLTNSVDDSSGKALMALTLMGHVASEYFQVNSILTERSGKLTPDKVLEAQEGGAGDRDDDGLRGIEREGHARIHGRRAAKPPTAKSPENPTSASQSTAVVKSVKSALE
jgi:hypothetical protein